VSRTYHHGERKIRVRGVRRRTDVKRLARALIELEYQQAQAEAEAEAEYRQKAKNGKRNGTTKGDRKGAA
jgi:flagellar biosynthesis/type III secretory pathway protein FliH